MPEHIGMTEQMVRASVGEIRERLHRLRTERHVLKVMLKGYQALLHVQTSEDNG